jgi:DNA repair protein RecN (Recombination protein N)
MLKSLRITDLATIEEIEVDLKPGFSVLTGETGAGKSILIESIRLALGEKGSPDVVRTGKGKTAIEAIFLRPPELRSADEETEDELFVQRSISTQGPGKGYIDGTLVPLKNLKGLQFQLVDIYGQNDHVFLRSADNQLDYLDHYGETLGLRREVQETARKIRLLFKEQAKLKRDTDERERRQEYLEFQITEIEKAGVSADEEEGLRQERKILKNAAQIRQWIDEAAELTYNHDHALSAQLGQLQKIVAKLGDYTDVFKDVEEAIEQFAITTQELTDDLMKFEDRQTASPDRLEEIEARLSLIENLKRKYGGGLPEVLAYLEKARSEHTSLDLSQDRLEQLSQELAQQIGIYLKQASRLSKRRHKAGRDLEQKLTHEISLLGMKKARLRIALTSLPPDPDKADSYRDHGADEVEFLLSPNPGEDLKPLRRIASGGELSRFMLALKSLGKESGSRKTLIFDEIDAGIGGKTADFVAQKLKSLALGNQVICITHLPQIASFARHHYLIDKAITGNRTYTTIKEISGEERVQEIARLLAGSHITATTLKNAREMLARSSPGSKDKNNA